MQVQQETAPGSLPLLLNSFIVLDNCEHLVTACAQVIESLLQRCSSLHILATSRETLTLEESLALCRELGGKPWHC